MSSRQFPFAVANSATPLTSVNASDVVAAVDWFGERESPFHFVVRHGIDVALEGELARLGYKRGDGERAMVLDAPRPPAYAGRLSMREVTGRADLEAYGGDRIGIAIARAAARFGFALLLGEVDGKAVARSMAVVTEGLVGVYNVSVAPEWRRRGFGEAITWAAVDAGLRRGASTAWLGSTEIGYSLYRRMGFQELYEYAHLEPPAP